ncbi:cell division protein FtsL [Pseudorhodobacter turbinis]|uniref:Cell division protein FtsL n=1 Tax=Pseudorhodobacter turbinis TaxID=2500533 RepID=A0A4P8EDQ3_9RHOB|nr:cell division protein FtsL [Pseudorhodobacter turbinis]QCO55111.1 cell division protein FtsL [Pseudorhodobacter turbinis]
MRPFLFILSAVVLMSLAFWAYRENYATQRAQKDVTALTREIAYLREALSQQRAEWAYLNRPSRLRDLVVLNFDSLGLLPMEPEQFGRVEQVAYPLPPLMLPELGMPVDTMGTLSDQMEDTP